LLKAHFISKQFTDSRLGPQRSIDKVVDATQSGSVRDRLEAVASTLIGEEFLLSFYERRRPAHIEFICGLNYVEPAVRNTLLTIEAQRSFAESYEWPQQRKLPL
jgi:hypothetical protein